MKLSKYFTSEEMACKGKDCCGGSYPMGQEFLLMLDKLREAVNEPIHVTNGFRCRKHNAAVKGSANHSKHTLGIAADIYVGSGSLIRLDIKAKELGFYTILYADRGFVHVDGRYFK